MVTVAWSVCGMQGMWPARLSVDAFGYVPWNVSVRRGAMGRFVRVQVGTVVLHCVDAEAISSTSAAWATAHACAASGLPTQTRAAEDVVGSWPPPMVSELVLAGATRWRVVPPHPGRGHTLVTSDWMSVRVFDRTALHLHTQVWALASDAGRRAWPEHPPTRYRDLSNLARFRAASLGVTVEVIR